MIAIRLPRLRLSLADTDYKNQPDLQVGAVAGHTYYFLMDVWPREMWYPGASKVEKGNVEGPIKAPRWL